MVYNMLPVPNEKFLIFQSINVIDSAQWNLSSFKYIFKIKTNLSFSVRLQSGTHIMYLNNSLIEQEICNNTIRIVTDIDFTNQSVRVAFSIRGSIINMTIY